MYSGIHASAGLLVVRVTLASIVLSGGHEMSLSPTREKSAYTTQTVGVWRVVKTRY